MHDPAHPRAQEQVDRVTELLDQRKDRIDASDVAVVIAHPDDETIGCGAQLARWSGVSLVLVTDGAPVNLKDAQAAGFATAAEYAAARRRELQDALAIAGLPRDALVTFDISDQQVAHTLVDVTRRLMDLVQARGLSVLFTHAYEGGHPDHDATAFAVHAAARLLARQGHPITLVEMPYYQAGDGDMARQRFTPAFAGEMFTVRLSPEQQALKRRMMAAHRTQQAILAPFDVSAEFFRIAPPYDFSELPNQGRLLYEQQDWGLNGREWLKLSRAALTELGLGSGPC